MEISAQDDVARYLFRGDYLVHPRQVVKAVAFIPSPRYTPPATSVFVTTGLTDNLVWDIGKQHVEPTRRGRTLKGWASLSVEAVETIRCMGVTGSQHLYVAPETSTHELHADILGWPIDETEQMEVAQRLAELTSLSLWPTA
ncbi:MAG: hypothetical protein ABIK09_15110 [Pseudomonadota bacterium]